MDVDSLLEDDDLDVQILEVKVKDESTPQESLPILGNDILKNNPVEEYLEKQLQFVYNQIDQTKNNIDLIEKVTENALQNLSTQCAYQEDVSSESDNDLYTSMGEPCLKKEKNKYYKSQQVLEVQHLWHRVIDNKWIIGVVAKSTTSCVLEDPTIYICPKADNEDCFGVSIFWTLIDDTFWYPAEEIDSQENFVATVTLDLPSFDTKSYIEVHGVISCEFNDKIFQSRIINTRLSIEDLIEGTCNLNFDDSNEAQRSILALKTLALDRVVVLPVQPETGKRLMKFLDKYAFKEVCKVCLVRNIGPLQYCIFEIVPIDDTEVRILIFARSEVQMSIVIQLMQEEFPEMLNVEKQEAINQAAEALCEELQLYLTCKNPFEIQKARIKSDLLIP